MNVLKDGTMANSLKYQTDIDFINIIIIFPTIHCVIMLENYF